MHEVKAYGVLAESVRHAFWISTDLDPDRTKFAEGFSDRVFKVTLIFSLRETGRGKLELYHVTM